MSYAFDNINVYMVAHQDDWQLFMEPNLSHDLADKTSRTVIIHTTAGDAGMRDGYWQAREKAAVGSLIFRLSAYGPVQHFSGMTQSLGRQIRRDEVNQAVIYFLRLPDGNLDGKGFSLQGYGSLERLRQGSIISLAAVDRSAIYYSFDEIVTVVRDILRQECTKAQVGMHSLTLNYPEYDEAFGPADHSDHYATGHLGAALRLEGKQRAFVHYDLLKYEQLLAGEDFFWKAGMFAVFHQVVLEEYGYSTLGEQSNYQQWCARHAQYRTVTSIEKDFHLNAITGL